MLCNGCQPCAPMFSDYCETNYSFNEYYKTDYGLRQDSFTWNLLSFLAYIEFEYLLTNRNYAYMLMIQKQLPDINLGLFIKQQTYMKGVELWKIGQSFFYV